MNFYLTIKQFILICTILLTIVFFFAFQNLILEGRICNLAIKINSTSPYSQLQLEGAEIIGLERLNVQSQINYSPTSIQFNKPGISDINVKLKIRSDPIRFNLLKDPRGIASAQISGVGPLENTSEALSIPIHINTNASFSKVRFDGMTIVGIDAQNRTDPNIFSYNDHAITINNTPGTILLADFNADIIFNKETGFITLEKSDDGIFSVDIAGYNYINGQTGTITLHNVPFIVEMTANEGQFFLNNGSIINAKIVLTDESSQNLIIDKNFIALNYTGELDRFHKSSYLLDLNLNHTSSLTIFKTNEGFVNTQLGGNDYFSVGSNPGSSYYSQTYPIIDNTTIDVEKQTKFSFPIIIETTSDWTDVSFEGLDNIQYKITGYSGPIEKPQIRNDILSIKKKSPRDTSFAQVNVTVLATAQNNPKIIIEKGSLNSTIVHLDESTLFLNKEHLSQDSRNKVSFELSQLSNYIPEKSIIYHNPISFIFPTSTILSEKGLTIADPQTLDDSISVSGADLAGVNIGMKRSIAIGALVFALISFALLIILLVSELIKEGFFNFLPGNNISFKIILILLIEIFERMLLSSVFIIEAIATLCLTPFLLLFFNEGIAEGAAILAYILLTTGVILRILEMKEIKFMEKRKEMFIKFDSLVILLATGFIASFDFMETNIGSFIFLVMSGITILFLVIVFTYMNRDLQEIL